MTTQPDDFCPACGTSRPADAASCGKCGRSFLPSPPQPWARPEPASPGCLILAPILLVVGWFWWSSNPPWPKSAGNTTCAEWVDQMHSDQRGVMADAILNILWEQDAAANRPALAVHTAFGNAIGPACTAHRSEKLSTVAAAVYLTTPAVRP